jgi:hypothetical protein
VDGRHYYHHQSLPLLSGVSPDPGSIPIGLTVLIGVKSELIGARVVKSVREVGPAEAGVEQTIIEVLNAKARTATTLRRSEPLTLSPLFGIWTNSAHEYRRRSPETPLCA